MPILVRKYHARMVFSSVLINTKRYIEFHLSLAYLNGFKMLLSVFWALGKVIILGLTGRPFHVQTYGNLWIDPVALITAPVCITAL